MWGGGGGGGGGGLELHKCVFLVGLLVCVCVWGGGGGGGVRATQV